MNYKDYPEFTVSGVTFSYGIRRYDSIPILSIVKGFDGEEGCGNPWNKVDSLGIRDEVIKHCPDRNRNELSESVKMNEKPSKTLSFMNRDEVKKFLEDYIGADCWMVYTLNDDSEPQRCYYNSFIPHSKRDERYRLIKDCTDLLNDLSNGLTVNLILNHWFIDVMVKKVPGVELYSVCEVRYNH